MGRPWPRQGLRLLREAPILWWQRQTSLWLWSMAEMVQILFHQARRTMLSSQLAEELLSLTLEP
jgi:hypothetical protein